MSFEKISNIERNFQKENNQSVFLLRLIKPLLSLRNLRTNFKQIVQQIFLLYIKF